MTQQEVEQLTNNAKMMAKDSISAKLAQCFITIDGNRYNFMSMTKFEAKFKKNKKKVAILGKTGAGNKATGWEGTFSATMHYNTSVMRELMEKFKNTGEDAYFEAQILNYDPTSDAEMQEVDLIGCNLDEGILAKFDATSEDSLDEDVSGTFEDFKIPRKFTLLDGMLD